MDVENDGRIAASIASTMRYARIADRMAKDMRASLARATSNRTGMVKKKSPTASLLR
jgi:hypothetical protein